MAVVLHLATFSPWRERDRRGILATVASKSPRDKSITRDQLASWDNEGGAPFSERAHCAWRLRKSRWRTRIVSDQSCSIWGGLEAPESQERASGFGSWGMTHSVTCDACDAPLSRRATRGGLMGSYMEMTVTFVTHVTHALVNRSGRSKRGGSRALNRILSHGPRCPIATK